MKQLLTYVTTSLLAFATATHAQAAAPDTLDRVGDRMDRRESILDHRADHSRDDSPDNRFVRWESRRDRTVNASPEHTSWWERRSWSKRRAK
ncbi:MAG: hypothetical protein AAGA22_09095 [Pseudomonadota bacterium]